MPLDLLVGLLDRSTVCGYNYREIEFYVSTKKHNRNPEAEQNHFITLSKICKFVLFSNRPCF
jgi:hypothetical protein